MLSKMLTPRWIITTLLVIVAVGVMARLGFWQLDRLAQRRDLNARVQAQLSGAPLDLNAALAGNTLAPDQLNAMQFRMVQVRGTYNLQEQVIVRNQVWENQPGYHLLTPLAIDGTPYVVMIDRGWIPLEQSKPAQWAQYAQTGVVQVQGQVQPAQNHRTFGVPDPTLAPGQARLDAWNAINLERIATQVQGRLLPVYVLAAPEVTEQTAPPYRELEQPDLSEGPHMSYAIQWFSFAAVLAVGYPYFVKKQLGEGQTPSTKAASAERKNQ